MEHVEGADQVDVYHGLETVGGDIFSRDDEVAGCAGNHHVELAERPGGTVQRRVHRLAIAHIGGEADMAFGQFEQTLHCVIHLFRIAAEHGNPCPGGGILLRDAKVDAAGAAGDEDRLARKFAVVCHVVLLKLAYFWAITPASTSFVRSSSE